MEHSGLDTVYSTVSETFKKHFPGKPLLVKSPGRVNLIGEHTDYNEGFVLPGAIDRAMVFAMNRNESGRLRVHALDKDDHCEIDLSGPLERNAKGWPDYILGSIRALKNRDIEIGGLDVVFSSNIPIGAGLSSSAALECGILYGVNRLYELGLELKEMAVMGKETENDFVGVQSGIMDQFVNLYGAKKQVVRLDCRSLDHEMVPFENEELRIILCDTNVRRELAASEYNTRRRQCEQGVAFLQSRFEGVSSLRDVNKEMLQEHIGTMDPVLYKRCCFVVNENERVLQAVEELKKGDFKALGRKMWESHRGLRYNYEVSCRELDILADVAMALDGVYGSRMMGGGFGGCTINLVETPAVEDFMKEIKKVYKKNTGRTPECYITQIARGTTTLNL